MLKFIVGDLFTTQLPAIGHGVNIHGVMGSGIAPIIKKKYPAVFPPYKKACQDGSLTPGLMLPVEVEPGMWVFNLASQDKPGRHARLDWLAESLERSFITATELNLPGFAIPRIGAGIGGLKWRDVKSTIERVASYYPHMTLEVWSLPDAKDD